METLFSIINTDFSSILAIIIGIGIIFGFERASNIWLRLSGQLVWAFVFTQFLTFVMNETENSANAYTFMVILTSLTYASLMSTFQILLRRKII